MSALSRHGRRFFGRRYLRVARPEEAIDWAAAELVAGLDAPALRALANLDRWAKPRRINGYLTAAIEELHLDVPDHDDCLRAYARDVATSVASGTLPPADGLRELAQIARSVSGPDALSPFLFLVDGTDPESYAELKGSDLDARIVAECRELSEPEASTSAESTPEPIMRCPSCMEVNDPAADFCRKCGMPLTSIAAMDPLKQVYAQGWVYRRAVGGRPSALTVWGMVLVFGPFVVMCIMGLLVVLPTVRGEPNPLGVLLSAAMMLLYAAILYRVISRYLRYRSIPASHCEKCGYDLRGLPGNRCPECGTPFDPEDLQA